VKRNGGDTTFGPMENHKPVQVAGGKVIAVEDEKGVIKMLSYSFHSPSGAQKSWFKGISNMHTPGRTIPKVFDNRLGLMVEVYYYLVNTMTGEQLQIVF
jgi:hypothetical protein